MLVENADGHQLVEVIELPEGELTTLIPLPLALVIARHADKTLLVFNRHKGHWELPGGMIDDGETPRAAAVRELFEETGQLCDARSLAFVGAARFRLLAPAPTPTYRREFGALFTVSISAVAPFVENPEVSAIEWWDSRADIGKVDAIDRWLASVG